MVVDYPELFSAITMLSPFLVGLYFFIKPDTLLATKIASLGCMLHAPFSMMLHFYKAFGSDPVVRTWLYKFDVAFMHVNLFLVGYAWQMRLQVHQLVYNVLAIVYLFRSDPLAYPSVKTNIDIIVSLCFLETSLAILFRASEEWFATNVLSAAIVLLHNKKIVGPFSSSVMHTLMGIPHLVTLTYIQKNVVPSWGYM
jgi:hypothetical protein